MTKLIHFPYVYHSLVIQKTEQHLREMHKERALSFDGTSFNLMINPRLKNLGINPIGEKNSCYSEDNAEAIALLIAELLLKDIQNLKYNYINHFDPTKPHLL